MFIGKYIYREAKGTYTEAYVKQEANVKTLVTFL